jgi:hypothetical protein
MKGRANDPPPQYSPIHTGPDMECHRAAGILSAGTTKTRKKILEPREEALQKCKMGLDEEK